MILLGKLISDFGQFKKSLSVYMVKLISTHVKKYLTHFIFMSVSFASLKAFIESLELLHKSY